MTPTKAAIQLLKVWQASRGENERFPVDYRVIAEGLKIRVHGEPFDDNFEGTLMVDEGVNASL